MKYRFINSGIEEEVSFGDEEIRSIFLPLLWKLTELQKQKGRRILVFLAAPPGAGKSTLADFLGYLSKTDPDLTPVQVIGMDGFHRFQDYLLTHTVVRDGTRIPMVRIKGAPVTFDLPLLEEAVRAVSKGEDRGWPVYDRMLHNPVQDRIRVTGSIVLLEGNYLLLNTDGWEKLKGYADLTISLKADEALLRERLVRRKISTGVAPDQAEAFVDFSDMVNVRTCLEKTDTADMEMVTDGDNYRVIKKWEEA